MACAARRAGPLYLPPRVRIGVVERFEFAFGFWGYNSRNALLLLVIRVYRYYGCGPDNRMLPDFDLFADELDATATRTSEPHRNVANICVEKRCVWF